MHFKKIFIVLIFVIFLTACNFTNNDTSEEYFDDQKENNYPYFKTREDGNTLLGIASFKEFESLSSYSLKKTTNTFLMKTHEIETISNEVNDYITYTYPFDYVKIHSATKFNLNIPEDTNNEALEVIIASCGFGDLEVTIANFTTYIIDKENIDKDTNNDEVLPSVSDSLISFKGSRGFYTILANSFSIGNDLNYDKDHKYSEFSSHKIITNSDIEKNFEPPIYCVQLEIDEDKQYSIAFRKDDSISTTYEFYNDKNLIHYSIDSRTIQQVSRDTLYEVFELLSIPDIEQKVQIVSIDIENKIIHVTSDTELSIVYIDEYTKYNNDTTVLWDSLVVGNYINVTYDYYFDGYEPIEVYANSIMNANIE